MKKAFAFILAAAIILSLAGCGSTKPASVPAAAAQEQLPAAAPSDAPAQEDGSVDNPAWDELEALGKIETEGGVSLATVTMPAEFSQGATQEILDASAGETYTSAKLNDDGSVTYTLTKKQHKAFYDGMTEMTEQALQEMLDSPDYAYTAISHNADYSVFDVHLSTEDIEKTESAMTLAFYLYGRLCGLFTASGGDSITVNYYNPGGTLINSVNSAGAGN